MFESLHHSYSKIFSKEKYIFLIVQLSFIGESSLGNRSNFNSIS